MADVVVEPQTGHWNMSPDLFHLHAQEYYRCKQSFTTTLTFSPVPYVLLGRAIELELKARHLRSNNRIFVRKRYGHKLKKLYDELGRGEKILDNEEYSVLVKASKLYDVPKKGFDYVEIIDLLTWRTTFPDLEILDAIARKLIVDI